MTKPASQPWIVMKFGGTSVSSAECWDTVGRQARRRAGEGNRVLIVVSALAGVTNQLMLLADSEEPAARAELLGAIDTRHRELWSELGLEPSSRYRQHWNTLCDLSRTSARGAADNAFRRAKILAHGELLSSALGHAALENQGLDAGWQDATRLLRAMDSNGDPLAVRCHAEPDPALRDEMGARHPVHITQGFIASDGAGNTCLLGRGGSDTSAACLAALLQAKLLEIWTDVPGMFSADPRVVPEARLLQRLSYSEAQELASMGARVLHPPSIQPVQKHGIELAIRDTRRPRSAGTRISARSSGEEAQVKGVVSRSNITLIHMESSDMWHQSGFLADVFTVFKKHGISVDLISTSEATVTVSLDPQFPVLNDEQRMSEFLADLERFCTVSVQAGCVSISLVGNAIRTILGRLSAALDVFQDRHVHLVTQSANDLNLTLVVDSEHAHSLVRKLHQLLISSQADSRPEFGPSWIELTRERRAPVVPEPWWKGRHAELIELMKNRESAYVYHLESARRAARRLLGLRSVSRVLYSVKANDHPELLRALAAEGTGFECVSLEEVEYVLSAVDGVRPSDLLFTPNFAPRREYERALERGVPVTVDNAWALLQWPQLFAGKDIFLRLDLDTGYGHHKKVITSGADSKFGISPEHLPRLVESLAAHGTRVTGLHAHTGSGVGSADVWQEQLERFFELIEHFPQVRVLDLGGGLGVPYRRNQAGFDLQRLDRLLEETLRGRELEIWLEPGRYLVAECGVLLSRVTQLKEKGQYRYLGVSTGMNSLIRPALYGAYHDMFNLSRLDEPADTHYRVVGPICESGDVLGEGRFLPRSGEGDVLLIATTGAYGRVMASSYNRRAPAEELIL